jgi:hypothetical protein
MNLPEFKTCPNCLGDGCDLCEQTGVIEMTASEKAELAQTYAEWRQENDRLDEE